MSERDDSILTGIRLVSWDVDGTLFSYLRLSAALARMVARCGMRTGWGNAARQARETWEFHRTVEKQRRGLNSTVIAAELAPFARAQEAESRMLEAALAAIPPRQRALNLLRRFSAAGVPQVALSDFECAYKLRSLGLAEHFAGTYSCRSLGFWKPSPVSLARIQQDFGLDPGQHLHVGDRPDTDGEACARNGCHFMLIDRLPKLWKPFNAVCAL